MLFNEIVFSVWYILFLIPWQMNQSVILFQSDLSLNFYILDITHIDNFKGNVVKKGTPY